MVSWVYCHREKQILMQKKFLSLRKKCDFPKHSHDIRSEEIATKYNTVKLGNEHFTDLISLNAPYRIKVSF